MITGKITELETKISSIADKREKVDAINQLAFEIRNSDTQRSILLCKESQKLSSQINYPAGNAAALANEGFCYVQITDYELAFEKSFEALKIFEELKNEKGIAQVHYNLCLVYFRISDFTGALESITRALTYYQRTNDTSEMARCFFQMGYLYHSLNDSAGSIEYFTQSLELNRSINNQAGEAAAIMGLGQACLKVKEYEKSREHLLKSMAIREQIKDWRGYAASMNAYMTLCLKTGKYEEAEKIALEGIQLATRLEDKMGVSRFMLDRGKIYLKQNNLTEAERTLLEALSIAEKINLKMALSPANQALSEIYQLKGDFEKALKHYQRFHKANEEILNTDAAMKAKSAQLLSKIDNAQKEAEINRLKNVELKNAYNEIAEKNKNITDSINYAKRIQQAKLPDKKEIYSVLPNCFVLFQPKDIVSGDFYFFHLPPNPSSSGEGNKRGEVFIAAADCTGHGVPGALMSMIGSEKLDEALLQTSDTSEILKLLNKGIKASLKQSEGEESTRDGMDIALVSMEFGEHSSEKLPTPDSQLPTKLKYAGANRPLWLIRKGQKEVEEIKATKKAIGGLTDNNQHFESHQLTLQKGDTVYLCTDGYADQFGGLLSAAEAENREVVKRGKKLMTKKFKEILVEIQDKTMKEQEKHLETFIEEWKAGMEQVDDILVIGIRF